MIVNNFHSRQSSISSRPSFHNSHSRHASTTRSFSYPYPKPVSTDPVVFEKPPSTPEKRPEPSWSNIPNKSQLAILAASRLVDFWQMASLQSYMVYQLRSFDDALPDSTISHQAGILQGAFTAAQVITSVLWGRAADNPAVGRKNVLLIGLIGTAFSCIGVGFANTFWQAAVWRLVGGAINGTVGSARTMVAECVTKEWHSRAFLLLPLAFNVANILGPVVGGILSNPIDNFPSLLGPDSLFGNIQWLSDYPYALPSLVCAILLFAEAAAVSLWLRETLPCAKGVRSLRELFLDMVKGIQSILQNRENYAPLASDPRQYSPTPESQAEKYTLQTPAPVLSFSRIWTSNVLWTLLSVAIFDFHMGAFSGLWIIFLSTHRAESEAQHARRDAVHFTGGLGFEPAKIGAALAILGIVGLALQMLLYPWANGRFGLMKCFRYSLFLFPLAYFMAPYIALLPSDTLPPLPATGVWIWMGISAVLVLQVTARTFALPASIILVNNASPHPSVLGTIHGVGQATSSAFRTIGPIASGYWYGVGLQHQTVVLAWWLVAAVSGIGCVASFKVRNGSGHEIILPGEEEDVE